MLVIAFRNQKAHRAFLSPCKLPRTNLYSPFSYLSHISISFISIFISIGQHLQQPSPAVLYLRNDPVS